MAMVPLPRNAGKVDYVGGFLMALHHVRNLPRVTGREPALLAEVPLDGGRYATLVISREQCTTFGTFPVFTGKGDRRYAWLDKHKAGERRWMR
jgi:hypothetical protein